MKIKSLSLEKIEKIMLYFFLFLAAGAIIGSIRLKSWETLLNAFLTFILLLLPTIFYKRTRIFVPPSLQIIILLFIFASTYLGELRHFFYRYWWWDIMLHSTSAIILGYIGFLMIYALNKNINIHLNLNPFFIALFTFCFALTVGVLWEIFEFSVDSILGLNMQKARNLEEIYGYMDTRLGVIDTMRDLLVNFIGAFFVSVIGYYYSKRKFSSDSAFAKIKDQFIEQNPNLFSEKID